MQWLAQPFRILWKVYSAIGFILTLVLMYPAFYVLLARKSRFPKAFRLIQLLSRLLRFFTGIWLNVKQRPQLPEPPYIICSNHSSYLDILLMYSVFPDYFVFMGKNEIASWPLFKIFFTSGMNILVDRGNRKASHQSLLRASEELDKGHCVMIFPEATIPAKAPQMKPFKNGAFKLSVDKQIPIVAVTFLDNWKRLQVGAALRVKGGPGWARAVIHEPIFPEDREMIELRKHVFQTIQGPLEEVYGTAER